MVIENIPFFKMEILSVSKDPGPISRQIHKDS